MEIAVEYPLAEIGDLMDKICKVIEDSPNKSPEYLFHLFRKEASVPDDKIAIEEVDINNFLHSYSKHMVLRYGSAAIEFTLKYWRGCFELFVGPNIDIYNTKNEFLYTIPFTLKQLA